MNHDRFPLGDLEDDWHRIPSRDLGYTIYERNPFPDIVGVPETTSGECGMARAAMRPLHADAPQSDGQTTANAAPKRKP